MDGWVDGWMGGWMDGWVDGWMVQAGGWRSGGWAREGRRGADACRHRCGGGLTRLERAWRGGGGGATQRTRGQKPGEMGRKRRTARCFAGRRRSGAGVSRGQTAGRMAGHGRHGWTRRTAGGHTEEDGRGHQSGGATTGGQMAATRCPWRRAGSPAGRRDGARTGGGHGRGKGAAVTRPSAGLEAQGGPTRGASGEGAPRTGEHGRGVDDIDIARTGLGAGDTEGPENERHTDRARCRIPWTNATKVVPKENN